MASSNLSSTAALAQPSPAAGLSGAGHDVEVLARPLQSDEEPTAKAAAQHDTSSSATAKADETERDANEKERLDKLAPKDASAAAAMAKLADETQAKARAKAEKLPAAKAKNDEAAAQKKLTAKAVEDQAFEAIKVSVGVDLRGYANKPKGFN